MTLNWWYKTDAELGGNSVPDFFRSFTSLQAEKVSKICLFFAMVVHLYVFLIFSNLAPPHPLPTLLQILSVGHLMEALRVKMKERKVLTEELAMLATPVSEKAWLPGLRLGKLSSSPFSPLPSLPSSFSTGAELSRAEPGRHNQHLWGKQRLAFVNGPLTSVLALSVCQTGLLAPG